MNIRLKLDILLHQMDVPQLRKDLTKPENIRWLSRNLMIRNSGHRNFSVANELIKTLLKELP